MFEFDLFLYNSIFTYQIFYFAYDKISRQLIKAITIEFYVPRRNDCISRGNN